MKIIKMDGLIDDLTAAVTRDELSGREFSIVKRYIMRQDAVDAVEVVRCKDCKYWEEAPLFYDGAMICMRSPDYITATNKMDFCSYGERREL